VTPAGAGSLAPNTTYYYKVTAIYANGETIGGNEISASTGANGALLLSWNAAATTGFNISSQTLTQVTGYNIYRGTAAGAENILAGHVAAGILSFNDTGAGVVAPAVNGTRLIPPVLNPIPPANVGGALAVNTYYYMDGDQSDRRDDRQRRTIAIHDDGRPDAESFLDRDDRRHRLQDLPRNVGRRREPTCWRRLWQRDDHVRRRRNGNHDARGAARHR